MASTLAHIKSRLLLPRPEVSSEPEAEEQGDPRAELVRRLLEYQKYKEAAEQLARQDIFGRDVFSRQAAQDRLPIADGEAGVVEFSMYKLIEALDRVLKNASPELGHEVVRERVSLSDTIHHLIDRLRTEGELSFFNLFEGKRQRYQIVVTFLAILEMCKLKLLRVQQEDGQDDIRLVAIADALTGVAGPTVSEVKDEYA